jgi:hypothetical protein
VWLAVQVCVQLPRSTVLSRQYFHHERSPSAFLQPADQSSVPEHAFERGVPRSFDPRADPDRPYAAAPNRRVALAGVWEVPLLFVFGLLVNLHFASRGFMPLDSSIVFDGGWRMLSRQVPFRDFVAPNGLVPAVMQVPFFGLWGITWFAYALHASFVNGLFAVGAYALIRLATASRPSAVFFAAMSALVFYPPTGTPFMDQHAFFFTLLMILAVVIDEVSTHKAAKTAALLAIPTLFAAGYLSCQVPTAFAAVLVALRFLFRRNSGWGWLHPIVIGTLGVVAAAVGAGLIAGVDPATAYRYMVQMPLHTAGIRSPSTLGPIRVVVASIRRMPITTGLWSFALACPIALALAWIRPRRVRWHLQLWVLATLALTTAAFLAFSKNEVEASLGLLIVATGVAAGALHQSAVEHGPSAAVIRRKALYAWVIVLVATATWDAFSFVRRVDATRMVLDTTYDNAVASNAHGQLPTELSFMKWTTIAAYSPHELTSLVRFLSDAPGNFVLIGDSAILYGLARKPSVMPALWFDPGLSVPWPRSLEFDDLETELMHRVHRMDVRRVVVEGSSTIAGVTLNDFTRLKQLTNDGRCGERSFGLVRVLELCPEVEERASILGAATSTRP